MTIEDISQQECHGGRGDERHGQPRTVRIPFVVSVPAHDLCIARSGLSRAIGGLLGPHRIKQAIGLRTRQPGLEYRLETR